MTMLKKVKIRRERASFPSMVVAFLVISVVFFLSTLSVKEEKNIRIKTADEAYGTREVAIEEKTYCFVALCGEMRSDSARLQSARLMQRGAAGYLYENNGMYYSIGNLYLSKDEAEQVCLRLANEGIKAQVICLPAKGVLLRVTAEETVLNASSFCLWAFTECENSLMDFSERLDKGDLNEREARLLLSVLEYDLGGQKNFAAAFVSESDDNAIKDICIIYLNMLSQIQMLTKNEGGEMMLSARIKHAATDLAMQRIAFSQSVSN